MPQSSLRTLSRNGQVSIPSSARKRWQTSRLLVLDLGDRVVIRPASDNAAQDLQGKYSHVAVTSDEMRRRARAEATAAERRRRT